MLLTLPLIQACGDIRVTQAHEDYLSLSTQGKICTDLPAELGLNTKILFVVDKSGSNATTDPNNVLRADSMRNLINQYAGNEHIYWGLIEFHGDGARFLIETATEPINYFTNDSAEALDAVSQFEALADQDATPYLAALSRARVGIETDLRNSIDEMASNYNVIFISDGQPTDSTDPQIMAAVDSIVNLNRGNVHLSTIYYGPDNAALELRLQDMADRGTGIYQKAQQGVPIDLSRFILASQSNEPYLIKKFMVYNMSSAMCDDGMVSADSDSDGLCDKDEERYNQFFRDKPAQFARMNGKTFSPTNRNSFHDHLSDSFYFRYIAYNEALPMGCLAADDEDEDMDMLSACEEKFLYNQSPQGPTTSWTDKMIQRGKQGDPKYFDSDGDGVLDSLEFFFFKDKSTPLNYNNLLGRTNGHDNESLIVNHLNPMNPSSETAYGGRFTKVDPDAEGRNCYTYSQASLPLYNTQAVSPFQTSGLYNLSHNENENVILIYFIEAPEYAPNSKGFLRYSYQKMKKDVNGARDLNLDTKLFEVFPRK